MNLGAGFVTGLISGVVISAICFILFLIVICSGNISKEEEAYRTGYEDGLNTNKSKGD